MTVRSVGGWKAQREGRSWEALFQFRCERAGVVVIRVPDGCRKRWSGRRLMLQAVKTPFDWVLGYDGKIIFCDTKSLSGKTLSFSACTPHQVAAMQSVSAHCFSAGYVVQFRDIDKVVYFRAAQLAGLVRGKGLKATDGLQLGGVEDFEASRLFLSA